MVEPNTYTNYFSHDKKRTLQGGLGSKSDVSFQKRVRLVEERFEGISKRLEVLEQNSLSHFRRMKTQIANLEKDIGSVKSTIKDLNDTIKLMIEEFKGFAKKGDVSEVQKYVELFDPMKFVTEEEINFIIDRRISEKNKKN